MISQLEKLHFFMCSRTACFSEPRIQGTLLKLEGTAMGTSANQRVNQNNWWQFSRTLGKSIVKLWISIILIYPFVGRCPYCCHHQLERCALYSRRGKACGARSHEKVQFCIDLSPNGIILARLDHRFVLIENIIFWYFKKKSIRILSASSKS